MRSSKSRSRGNKNRSRQSHSNNQNRVFDSSGPQGKVRGTPQQIIEKYNQLARDAQLGDDRVAVENFQQHAEHYTRMLADALREADAKREQQEAQSRDRQQQRDSERQERDAARSERDSERPANQGNQGGDKQVDPASAPQPDMAAVEPAADNGLVDTPESKPAPRKRTRKPKVNPLQQADKPDTPEAAE
ncbi:MAG: DUF4167 domain-containing protein [Marinosulfonomonas sp.]|nr:DUF4167 domain-containing protein [Marinosulfonomonas sp.]